MKKTRFIPLDSFQASPPKHRLCDHDGCPGMGEFSATKSATNLRDYYWFCLDHVREYNKAWDFYKGMSTQEIEASRVSDVTWNRPSWPVGGWHTLLENATFLDGLQSFFKSGSHLPAVPPEVQKALSILELALPLTIEVLKKQYKKLAKRHHPDLNPNDKLAEERLKDINESYQVVKKYLNG